MKLESLDIEVVDSCRRWPRNSRRACLNSFGYGGANAHAILESVDSFLSEESLSPTQALPGRVGQFLCLPITAASTQSLQSRVLQISRLIPSCTQNSLANVAYSLESRVSHFGARNVVIVRSSATQAPNSQQIDIISDVDVAGSEKPLDIAFVFTGQGAQYAGMGKQLLHHDVFQSTVGALDKILNALPSPPSWTIRDSMLGTERPDEIDNATLSQTICTALQIALVDLLRNWNLTPVAVVGHSSGEIAAAYAAGLLTAKQSILIAYFRGCSVERIKSEGGMLAVGLETALAENLIQEKGLRDQVCIACINSPDSVTLSGSIGGIALLEAGLQRQGKFVRKLNTGGRAYHSFMMREVGAEYERLLQPIFEEAPNIDGRATRAKMYSSVGPKESIVTKSDMSARYWRNNLENPVQFLSAATRLMEMKPIRLLEIGPHSFLKSPIKQIRASLKLDDNTVPYAATLIRSEDADLCMKRLAASLFIRGYRLPWSSINTIDSAYRSHFPGLPPYPWDYSAALNYHEPQLSVELRHREYPRHPLLGSLYAGGQSADRSWRNTLQFNELPWISDHKFGGRIIFPAAAYMAIVIEALRQIESLEIPLPSFEFRNVGICAALSIEEDNSLDNRVVLYTNLSPRRLSMTTRSVCWYDFTIASSAGNTRTINCDGSIRVRNSSSIKEAVIIDEKTGHDTESVARWYEAFRTDGLEYGRHFQSITGLSTSPNPVATGTCTMWPCVAAEERNQYAVHPIAIDACLQMGIMSSAMGDVGSLRAYMPTFIEECRICPGDAHAFESQNKELTGYLQAQSSKTSFSTQRVACTLENSTGQVVVSFKGARMAIHAGRLVRDTVDKAACFQRHPCLRVIWKPDIQMLHPNLSGSLNSYIDTFKSHQNAEMLYDERLAVVGALIDLAGHKNPQLQVLEIGETCDCKSKHWLQLLNSESPFPRFGVWKRGILNKDGRVVVDGKVFEATSSGSMFDVIIIPSVRLLQSNSTV